MLDPQQFREMIDSARTDPRASGDPDLAEAARHMQRDPAAVRQWEEAQRADEAILSALVAAPVPAGLAEKLLLNLAAAERPAAPPSGQSAELTPASMAAPPPRARASRRWYWAAVCVAASLFAAVSLWSWLGRAPVITAENVPQLASEHFAQERAATVEIEAASSILRQRPPTAFPASTLHGFGVSQWRPVGNFLGARAVAFDLTEPRLGIRATLYALRYRDLGLPAAPVSPQSSTGGVSVCAWQSDGVLYVLAVEGDSAAFRQFLRPGGVVT
jgi:hypothetical protein